MAGDKPDVSEMSPDELKQEFPYDDRPVQPRPEEHDPFETLVGRGQTESTPMGLGPVLSWAIFAAFILVALFIFGYWLFLYPH